MLYPVLTGDGEANYLANATEAKLKFGEKCGWKC